MKQAIGYLRRNAGSTAAVLSIVLTQTLQMERLSSQVSDLKAQLAEVRATLAAHTTSERGRKAQP